MADEVQPSKIDRSVTMDWADGEYTFGLSWNDLERLQEDTGCGPMELLTRLQTGKWKPKDIADVIRNALIGGGTDPAKALSLVRNYVEPCPPALNLDFATGALYVGLFGFKQKQSTEPEAEVAANG